ncbi:DUF3098 domain-containing protein [Putridiphycobacter roseus]|uniref:DUF3098 domain-containing protein n=1 Tax=Putridiphycobacter roseus TaxID=2219161 RepID=A0A2W1NVL1_9FLAO|nr:DUF3098 domain-containing protein [Putridiphycobacter roseus]PZE18838.1 DUF3098 domain-containing protein [Putridiphycobacter roseus]
MEKENFVFGKDNKLYIIIGFCITLLGFLLMMGGGSEDPTVFNEEELFSPIRITVAPFLVILGYVGVLYGIMKKKKNK